MQGVARSILFVDDEAPSRKWFQRCFGDEFDVATAASADQAMEILATRGEEFAALVTDYRMPERDGMKLLGAVQRGHRHLIRLLVTAYAEKDVAIAAVNQGKVLRILEKPLEDEPTREALREALAAARRVEGPILLRVPVGTEQPGTSFFLEDPVLLARQFQDWLGTTPS